MSKLSNEYPTADPSKYLIFDHPWQKDIDPIFAGRLAALAKDMGTVIHILSGKRSTDEQIQSYRETGGKRDANGNWYGGNGYAAVPGRSWHEYGVAIDIRDAWLKGLEKDASTAQQIVLRKYGLFKPLTKGNMCNVLEDWHIQPIETCGVGQEGKQAFLSYKDVKPKTDNQDAEVLKTLTGIAFKSPEYWEKAFKDNNFNPEYIKKAFANMAEYVKKGGK